MPFYSALFVGHKNQHLISGITVLGSTMAPHVSRDDLPQAIDIKIYGRLALACRGVSRDNNTTMHL